MSKKIFFGALSAGMLLLAVYGLRSGGPLLNRDDNPSQAPAIILAGARLVKHDSDGYKLWDLEAQQIDTFDSESTVTDVTLRFFNREHHQVLIVKAPKAHLEHRTGNIRFWGRLSATGDEFSFTTEELRWDAQRKLLYTDAAIRVMGEEFLLSGEGFEYLTETGLVTIRRGAYLQLKKPSKEIEGEEQR